MELKMAGPNVFLAGLPKCGTTSMARCLEGHRQIHVACPKETHYWCPRLQDGSFAARDVVADGVRYARLFEGTDRPVRVDGSTTTLWYPGALERIRSELPESRFIVMLRNPSEIAPAVHREEVAALHEEEADFAVAWGLQDRRAAGRDLANGQGTWMKFQYRWIACAGQHVRRLWRLFPREQTCLVILDDWARQPGVEYRRVLEFLGLEHDGRGSFPKENVSGARRLACLQELILRPPGLFAPALHTAKQWLHRRGLYGWRSGLVKRLRLGRRIPPIPRALEAELRDVFAAEIDLMEQQLGRDLSAWRRGGRLDP